MGKHTTYELKIEPKYYNEVYRIIRIDGSKTLDNLSNEILSVFNFDDDHLYMFSLQRKKYDREGYYHPQASGGKRADKISLNKLNLKVRNKFLFLYDFGDEWLFDITVIKIEESDILSLTFVKEEKGEIIQYPDWTDEEWEDENEELSEDSDIKNEFVFMDSDKSMSDFLAKNKPSELKKIMKYLGIKVNKAAKTASDTYAQEIVKFLLVNKEKLLDILTPSAAYFMMHIADKDSFRVPLELINSLDVLINMGLVAISDEYESFTIETAKELYEFADFYSNPERVEIINKSYEWQNIISELLNFYGVVDLELLHRYLCKHLEDNIEFEVLKKRVLMPFVRWELINVLENDKMKIATLFDEEQTELILTERNNYDINDYKKLDSKELLDLITKGVIGTVPSLSELTEYFIFEKALSPNVTAYLVSELSLLSSLGVNKDTILEMFQESVEKYSLKLTKKLKSIILKVIEQYPCSLLMGYSWHEYNNRNKLIDNQISLFDDLT